MYLSSKIALWVFRIKEIKALILFDVNNSRHSLNSFTGQAVQQVNMM